MWSSRLFWKLFLTYSALSLLAALAFVLIVSGWQDEQVTAQVAERLRETAMLLRREFQGDFPMGRSEELQARVRNMGAEIGTRITLIARDGTVLADSSQGRLADVAEMENHKNRVELIQAARKGVGRAARRSPTIDESMLYFAIRVDNEGKHLGFVRTALPMHNIELQVRATQRLIWLVGILVSGFTVGVTYVFAAQMVRPITGMTRAAEAIAEGDYETPVYVNNQDELGTLARSFNRMREQLAARESQLRESSQRLETVMSGMVEGVIALDHEDRILLANAAAGRLLGFSAKRAEGQTLLQVVRDHNFYDAVLDARRVPSPRLIEIEPIGAERRTIAVNASRLPGLARDRVVLVLYDVTELRRLESLRQEFIANVSHELKTPLSAIKAYAETLSHGALNDPANNLRFVQRIEEQAERLHQLILDMLSLSRIESGREAFEISSVCVFDVVQQCLSEHRDAAEQKGIILSIEEPAPLLQVRADEEALKQILHNLIDNAIKYTTGGGSVTVSWRQDEDEAIIAVRDTGIGIGADHLSRVFERFYRADKARSRELGGTGLGLSIVKHLAQVFGGSVDVTSTLGKGSCFTVRLPLG